VLSGQDWGGSADPVAVEQSSGTDVRLLPRPPFLATFHRRDDRFELSNCPLRIATAQRCQPVDAIGLRRLPLSKLFLAAIISGSRERTALLQAQTHGYGSRTYSYCRRAFFPVHCPAR
jgi:hypothetical protein